MKEYQVYKDENFHPEPTGSPKRGQMNMTKIFLLQQVNVEKEYYKQDRVKFGMISCCNCPVVDWNPTADIESIEQSMGDWV